MGSSCSSETSSPAPKKFGEESFSLNVSRSARLDLNRLKKAKAVTEHPNQSKIDFSSHPLQIETANQFKWLIAQVTYYRVKAATHYETELK